MALVTLRFRRGTASEWTTANPVLALGEPGWERDNNKGKVGDGSTDWNSLPYSLGAGGGGGGGGGSVASTDITDSTAIGRAVLTAVTQGSAQSTLGVVPTTTQVNGHALSGNVTVTAADVGLGSANNTADAAKNVLSAATLTTPRTIAGVSFNGSANISIRLDQLSAPTASVSLNSQKITNLATPTLTTDAATKDYVDTGLALKVSASAFEALVSSTYVGITNTVFFNTGTVAWPTLDPTQSADANVAWHFVGGDVSHAPPSVTGNAVWDHA